MLKSVMYYLILLTTAVRLADIVYLLLQETVPLPAAVLVVSSGMVLYGILLLVRRFVSAVRVRPMMIFFIIQIIAILFNIAWVALASPLVPTMLEVLVMGSFLEVLVDGSLVYLCMRQLRRRSIVTVGHIG